MEKEQILSTLNEQLGQTSLSQRTISDYVDNNLPAEGVEFDFERHAKILKSLNGQYSADVAKQVEDFKKNYKPSDSTTETQNKGEKSELEKRIEQLERANAEHAKNATANNLRSEVTAKGKSLKVANEAIWEDAVKAVQIGENMTADEVTAEAKKIYERQLKRYVGEGAAPYGSSGRQGASKEAEKEQADRREAFFDQQRKAGRLPKKQ